MSTETESDTLDIFDSFRQFFALERDVLGLLFVFSGLRFAGLPAHKALIVGPAEAETGGRITGSYYLLRNIVVIPSAAVGGWLYTTSPTLAFTVASVVGLIGVGYFSVFGEEYTAYTS